MTTHAPSVSPELALVDPELALRLREGDVQGAVVREEDVHDANNGNGSAPTATQAPPGETRSLEALLFHGGLITADQLGDLIREQTATGIPVEELVRSKGYVQPEVLDRLLGKTQAASPAPAASEAGGFTAPIELVPAAEAPAPAVAAVAEPAPAPIAIPAPEPVAVAPAEAPAPAADVVELPTAFAAPVPEAMPVLAEVAPAPVVEAVPAPVVELPVAPAPMPEPEPQAEPEPPAAEHAPEPEHESQAQLMPELAFDVIVRLADGYELLASSHASLADGEQAARALAAGGDWLEVGDGIVQRPAVAAILLRPRSSR